MANWDHAWPIFVKDKRGHAIYLTTERWEHALDHPGMNDGLLDTVLKTLRQGRRKQDAFEMNKFKYSYRFPNLPLSYTHMVVVVKFGKQDIPSQENNFILTAYMIEKW